MSGMEKKRGIHNGVPLGGVLPGFLARESCVIPKQPSHAVRCFHPFRDPT